MNNKPFKSSLYLLLSMYVAGIIGLSFNYSAGLFQFLTPFHLLTSFFFLIYFQNERNRSFYLFLLISFLVGYFIEVAGVKTGLIFGKYQYLTTLGWKILEVPPMIGVNWSIMVVTMGMTVQYLFKNQSIPFKTTFGALLLTAFDFIVEPVAISQKMWDWYDKSPPLQNYVAWFLVAWFLLFLFNKFNFRKENQLAMPLFLLQLMFFLVLRILLWF
jgi:putative membrane protein